MHRSLSILLLLTLACASNLSQRPANIPQPDLDARLVNPLFFGSGTTAPATIELTVVNRAQVPLVVRRVEIDSPGMSQFTLQRYIREYNDTLAAGETKRITVFATAIAQTTRRPSEPLNIRALVHFRAEGKEWREVLLMRGAG